MWSDRIVSLCVLCFVGGKRESRRGLTSVYYFLCLAAAKIVKNAFARTLAKQKSEKSSSHSLSLLLSTFQRVRCNSLRKENDHKVPGVECPVGLESRLTTDKFGPTSKPKISTKSPGYFASSRFFELSSSFSPHCSLHAPF